MEADRNATGWVGRFEHASQPTATTTINGDHATVIDSYGVRWTPPATSQATPGGGALFYRGQPRAWHAAARRDRTGWRLWSVTIPPWCGSYSRCGAAPPRRSRCPSSRRS